MDLQTPQLIANIINFLFILFFAKHFFFDKMKAIVETRQNDIISQIKEAEENNTMAKNLKKENETALKNAKQEGKLIVENYKSKAEKVYEDIVKEARDEAEKILNRSKQDAVREKEKAEEEIKVEAVDLALQVSAKALEKSINEAEHRRLIEDFISKVGM